MALELAQGNDLFDFVSDAGEFGPELSRYYFHQLISTLKYCHDNGYSHRDLKPDNLLFDAEFNLKLADFGFSKKVRDKKMQTYLGTPQYMSPELHLKQKYDGEKNDIFACGVILFIMYTGFPPFNLAKKNDPYYKLLMDSNRNKMNIFWNTHEKNKT